MRGDLLGLFLIFVMFFSLAGYFFPDWQEAGLRARGEAYKEAVRDCAPLGETPARECFWVVGYGDSMYPAIRNGSRICVAKLSTGEKDALGVCDIVLFYPKDVEFFPPMNYTQGFSWVAHRVVEAGEDENGKFLVVMGDNNDMPGGKLRLESDIWLVAAVA